MSMMRDCEVVRVGSSHYLLLATNEHGTLEENGVGYGPFISESKVMNELSNNHSNPGGFWNSEYESLDKIESPTTRRLIESARRPNHRQW